MDLKKLQLSVFNFNNNNFDILDNEEENKALYNILLENKIIKINKQGRIKKLINRKIFVGSLLIKKRFGFVLGEEDLYIHNTNGYFENDIVVSIISEKKFGNSVEGIILDYLVRGEKKLLVEVIKNKNLLIMNEQWKGYTISLLKKTDIEKFEQHQIIQVQVKNVKNKTLKVEYLDIITDRNDPDMQMQLVLATYGINTVFSEATLKQVESLKTIENLENKQRVDLRDKLTFTIDGEDSKDLDDAIGFEKIDENYHLTVSISDVSHYVTEDSPLDIDAFERSTSVYFVDRVVPMLPKELSNGICSLHPNVDRLTITCDMLLDNTGKVISHKIYPSIINSNYRFTYNEVNDILHEEQISELSPMFNEMNKLRLILNNKRLKRGSFNLEDKEAKFVIDDAGEIINIIPSIRYEAEKIIEEFMIVTNETVAKYIDDLKLPFIYRVHDKPNPKKLQELLQMFYLLGVKINIDAEDFEPMTFKKILDDMDDIVSKRIASDLIVRSLSKARYQQENTGHFGLASKCYTHFTSPIRRYSDLIVHRKLRQYIFNQRQAYNELDIDKLNQIGVQTSKKEVSAIKASKQIEDMKKAKYMQQFQGEHYIATVASIQDYGFFVELDNTIRGLIKFNKIKEFKKLEANKIIFNDSKIFVMGDKIDVILDHVVINQGIVEFHLKNYTMLETQNVRQRNYKQRRDNKLERNKKYSSQKARKSNKMAKTFDNKNKRNKKNQEETDPFYKKRKRRRKSKKSKI